MWKGIIIKLVRILSGEGRGGGWAAAGNNLLRYAEADKEGCAEETAHVASSMNCNNGSPVVVSSGGEICRSYALLLMCVS